MLLLDAWNVALQQYQKAAVLNALEKSAVGFKNVENQND